MNLLKRYKTAQNFNFKNFSIFADALINEDYLIKKS